MLRALVKIIAAAAVIAAASIANATWSDVWTTNGPMRRAMTVNAYATTYTSIETNANGTITTNTFANDINQFQNWDFQALTTFTGLVGILYATNISIQPRERFGFDALRADYERVKVFSGQSSTNASDSDYMHRTNSDDDDIGLSRHLFRAAFSSDASPLDLFAGYAYSQLVALKYYLAAPAGDDSISSYLAVTGAYTEAQFDGASTYGAISNWTPITICAFLAIPTNYLYWTPQRQLDGRGPGTSREATNWHTLYNPAISNGVTHTQTVYGVWTNVAVTGTNGQRVAVVTTNANILPGFTDMDYTWPSMKQIYGLLHTRRYTSAGYAASQTNTTCDGEDRALCPTNASLGAAHTDAGANCATSGAGVLRYSLETLRADACGTSGVCNITAFFSTFFAATAISYEAPTLPTNMPESEVMIDYYGRPTAIYGGYDPIASDDGGLEYGTNQWSHIGSVTVQLDSTQSARTYIATPSSTPLWAPSGWESDWSCTNFPSSQYGWSGLEVMAIVNGQNFVFD